MEEMIKQHEAVLQNEQGLNDLKDDQITKKDLKINQLEEIMQQQNMELTQRQEELMQSMHVDEQNQFTLAQQ